MFNSLRVNLDMGKLVYTWVIMQDKGIPNTIVRNSMIPEELGRVEYLMTDKTGTLTQNEMVFKKLCLGQQTYTDDNMDELRSLLSQIYPSGAITPQYNKEGPVSYILCCAIVTIRATTFVVSINGIIMLCHVNYCNQDVYLLLKSKI